MGDVVVVR